MLNVNFSPIPSTIIAAASRAGVMRTLARNPVLDDNPLPFVVNWNIRQQPEKIF
jgi:hypothetical protein